MTRSVVIAGCLAAALALPAPVQAQLGLVEGLFRNVTDVAFYYARSEPLPDRDELETGDFGIYGFGVELLFGVGANTRRRVIAAADPGAVRYVPRELRVERAGGDVDSVFVYDVVRPGATVQVDTLWLFELGIGYGQLAGFDLAAEGTSMSGAVRELPALSFYATHDPSGVYFGVRSGLLQTNALSVYLSDGTSVTGSAQTFQLGGVLGYGVDIGPMFPFVEAGYMLRHFPGLEWRSSTVPPEVPRTLTLSGWQVLVGVQVGLKR